jgi:hypothetical protein
LLREVAKNGREAILANWRTAFWQLCLADKNITTLVADKHVVI